MTDVLSTIGDTTLTKSMLPSLSAKISPNANIDKTSQDFEAMFATQMLQPMFEGVGADPTFGGGHGEEVMRSFLLQEYGKKMAQTGRFGIASKVKSEMLRAQEASNARSANERAATAAYTNTTAVSGASNVSLQ